MDIGRIERIVGVEMIDEVVPVPDPQPAPTLDPDAVPVRASPTRSHRSSGTGHGRAGARPAVVSAWARQETLAETEPLRAKCLAHGAPSCFKPRTPEHTAPDQCCTCGIHAVFAPWDLGFHEQRSPWTLVAGRVEGWGRVALGEKGFRAELARPRELFAELWWDDATRRAGHVPHAPTGSRLSRQRRRRPRALCRLSGIPPHERIRPRSSRAR